MIVVSVQYKYMIVALGGTQNNIRDDPNNQEVILFTLYFFLLVLQIRNCKTYKSVQSL